MYIKQKICKYKHRLGFAFSYKIDVQNGVRLTYSVFDLTIIVCTEIPLALH